MKNTTVGVSAEYRKKLGAAIFSIVLFIIVFLLLVAATTVFAGVCGYFGLALIIAKPSFLTLMVGGGLVAMGLLVFVFVVKFLFTRNKQDLSGMIEINRNDEPRLFAMIDDIVAKAGTSAPKKTFLTTNVNAAVFYDSSFWSMFLPVKKNLMIGMGLIHSTTEEELKAVLSHEFGHFSQRSMKVGSYVYNVNKVIYNMLYENDSYVSFAQQIANINGYFSFFVNLAFKVVIGIQWLLRQVYKVVNLRYMGLSREMEFHADHVAASIVGSKPCMDSLLRLGLADQCFEKAIQYYNLKIKEGIKTKNLYNNHDHVLQTLGADAGLPLVNGIPQISQQANMRFQNSRIVIKDQWASHPDTLERVRALEKLNIPSGSHQDQPAVNILQQRQQQEEALTEIMFAGVNYDGEVKYIDSQTFGEAYNSLLRDIPYHEMFNHYYDRKDPQLPKDLRMKGDVADVSTLFGDDKVEAVFESITLQNDIDTLGQISRLEIETKTFDYNGEKFNATDASGLMLQLQKELEQVNRKIDENDLLIYNHFLSLARLRGDDEGFAQLFNNLQGIDKANEEYFKAYYELRGSAAFMSYELPYEEIEKGMGPMKEAEAKFRVQLAALLADPYFQFSIHEERRKIFNDYLEKERTYFTRPQYDEDALAFYYSAMNECYDVLVETRSNAKREILDTMQKLETALVKA